MKPLVEFIGEAPETQNIGDAGYDLKASSSVRIPSGSTRIVPVDLRMAIPKGYTGMVCSRSGMAARDAVFVLNAPGIIDSGYRGQVRVILHNAGDRQYDITAGDRIAQLLFVKAESVEWQRCLELDDTDRGAGGFGSTGQ